ncbi:MAG: hypothetical protein K2X87_02705 [Gemmataceae bacterium]|nr:hypothetical protein [Gemmataceae bacterium]
MTLRIEPACPDPRVIQGGAGVGMTAVPAEPSLPDLSPDLLGSLVEQFLNLARGTAARVPSGQVVRLEVGATLGVQVGGGWFWFLQVKGEGSVKLSTDVVGSGPSA